MYVSEIDFKNLQVIRHANQKDELAIVSTKILKTQEKVALLVAIYSDGEANQIVPLGQLCDHLQRPCVSPDSLELTKEAHDQLDTLKKRLSKTDKYVAILVPDESNGHIYVTMMEIGAAIVPEPIFILPWDNPFEIYEDPSSL